VESGPELAVREMRLDEVHLRIDYFHDASDEYLHMLGVDRTLLPSREAWLANYEEEYTRPVEERQSYSLVWEVDDRSIGFSSADRIAFGQEAFMHLHVVQPELRRVGLGTAFVRRSADVYFDVFQLERLFCEPNAFNTAPNRTLQRAGFKYLSTQKTTPGPINFPQVTNRWLLERGTWRV
jgi:RimJ/RimL family protein N-acetyltransferase